jgi:polyisoprenoid-binding protein YceI
MSVTTRPLVGTFSADTIHSTLRFALEHHGVSTFSSTFDDFDVTVVGDDQGVRVEGSVRVASLAMKHPDFRAHVIQGADFFDASNHPELSFRSTNVVLYEDGTAVLEGELTIKGITKPFTANGSYRPVTEMIDGQLRAGVDFETTVDRRDWEFNLQATLPKGGDALGTDIKITAQVELVKEA